MISRNACINVCLKAGRTGVLNNNGIVCGQIGTGWKEVCGSFSDYIMVLKIR